MEKLKKFAAECTRDAEHVQQQFSAWQQKAEAIRRVCEDESCELDFPIVSKTETDQPIDRANTNHSQLAAESNTVASQQEYLVEDISRLKVEEVDRKRDVDLHREQYIQASKPFSPGMCT